MSYNAFISYSHAADGLLAPRLQAGLQRFAKPWWKRRAIRVFRDESSLAANPHLWSSITDALDDSEWFILLLSPDAGRSTWVSDEVAYWMGEPNTIRSAHPLRVGRHRVRSGAQPLPQRLFGLPCHIDPDGPRKGFAVGRKAWRPQISS